MNHETDHTGHSTDASTWPGVRFRLEATPAPKPMDMVKTTLPITFLAIAAITVGCQPAAKDTPQTTSAQIEKVKHDTQEAMRDMKDYTYAEKAKFADDMRKQLAEINRDLDQLSARIAKSSDAVKAEAAPKLQALRDQTAQLSKQLDEINNASESTWDAVKGATSKAYASLKEGFQQSRQWVSDKIAP